MRKWLYDLLNEDQELRDIHEGRVFQGQSLKETPKKPFLVYRLGNDTSENLSEGTGPRRQFFQVYIHDQFSDYSRIDELVARVKYLLENSMSPEDNILQVRYLETSRDLDDQVHDTIFRYVRFQAVLSR
jgi:hypothetical protein